MTFIVCMYWKVVIAVKKFPGTRVFIMSLVAALVVIALSMSLGVAPTLGAQSSASQGLTYPKARVTATTMDYHGTSVADPYFWMEELNDPDLKNWIEANNKVTREYLDGVPQRAAFLERIKDLWNYETFGMPEPAGDRYIYRHNAGLQDHRVLKISDTPCGEGDVLIDPNTFPKDSALSLRATELSYDGRYMAYSLNKAGSDWNDWFVRDLKTGKNLDDYITYTKNGGVSWHPDGSGFWYSRYPEPKEGEKYSQLNLNQKVYFHKLGRPQSEDTLVYERPDRPELRIGCWPSEDAKDLYFWEFDPRQQGYAVKITSLSVGPVKSFGFTMPNNGTENDIIGKEEEVLFVRTNRDAPRYRIVNGTPTKEDGSDHVIIPQSDVSLDSAEICGDTIVCQYVRDCTSEIKLFALDGTPKGSVKLPGDGTVRWGSNRRSIGERFFTYTDGVTPATVYRWEEATNTVTLVKRPAVKVDVSQYSSQRVFFRNRDGLKVPLFISHKKGLVMDGSNPTILYGYGGFNSNTRNGFSSSRVAWMEKGCVFVQACLRGDGDYGEAWHMAANKINKQRTFDDFIDAAEFLIKSGYTSSPKLAISGGSNGGLLVGACVNQRPDLFGAAIPSVGVMDMLRFHKFTVGAGWIREYGCSDDPLEFQALYAYSPYHNIKRGVKYPAIMVTTSDHDDRVVPSHSFKYAARLQAYAEADSRPRLIRIETKGGHGGGTTTSEALEYVADYYAFLMRELHMGEK